MNIHTLPRLYGVAIDSEKTQRFDDIFWIERKDKEYILYVCTPSVSQRDQRVSMQYELGFVKGVNIPSVCYEFHIKSFHNTVCLKSFKMYECWAVSIANIHPQTDLLSLPDDIFEMLTNASALTHSLKHLFQKTGVFDKEKSYPSFDLLNVNFFMVFVNMVIANFAVKNCIPLLYYNLVNRRSFEVNVGTMKLLPHYAHVTSPLRRLADIVNQCNMISFFKSEPYPLDHEDIALLFGIRGKYNFHPRKFEPQSRIVVPIKDIKPIVMAMVMEGDYVTALDKTYKDAGKPLPIYKIEKIRKSRLVSCTLVVIDLITDVPHSVSITSNKNDAERKVAKEMYNLLQKRCIKKAV